MAERRQIGSLAQAGPIEQVSQMAVLDERVQLLAGDRPTTLCARRTEEGREALMIFRACATRGRRLPSLDARSGRSISPHP